MHLEELEKKRTITFKYDKPYRLMYLLRQAINTTHFHLKSFYRFKVIKDGVTCLYEPPLSEIEIEYKFLEVNEEVDYWGLAQSILEFTAPTRYTSFNISESELESLKALAEKNNRNLIVLDNQIELI